MSKWIKNQKIHGQNHNPPYQSDSISFRSLMPDRTKKQIKAEKNLRKFVLNNPGNSKVKKIEGASLVAKHIADGNAEEANRCLGRLIFEEQIKPSLDIVAAGIEKDLITFTAEDIW